MPLVQCNNYRIVNTGRLSKDGASCQILIQFLPFKIITSHRINDFTMSVMAG